MQLRFADIFFSCFRDLLGYLPCSAILGICFILQGCVEIALHPF